VQQHWPVRFGILLTDPAQRYAVKTVVSECGYEVTHCSDTHLAHVTKNCHGEVNIWLTSQTIPCGMQYGMRHGKQRDSLAQIEQVFIEEVPTLATAEFRAWKQFFKLRLEHIVHNYQRNAGNIPAKDVWLLAASTGGLTAVKQFLSQVKPTMGVGFVYAQHIEVEQAGQLVKTVERNSQWRAEMANTGRFAAEGYVTIIPPEEKVSIGKDGVLGITGESWSGRYKPSIDGICVELATYYQQCSGMIVFTGMGDDGVAGSKTIKDRGGNVWVQSPQTCTAPALPEGVIAYGEYDFSASIDELSCRFNTHMSTERRATVSDRSQ